MTAEGAKILVVDDVAENRDLLKRRLQRLGVTEIDEAVNGVEALKALETTRYDLMLLDLMMPELDGFGVIDRLRQQRGTIDLPIVVVSAMNEMDAIVRCIEAGAEDFLFKPINPTMLRARVLSSLEKKKLRDQTREQLRRKIVELNEARSLQLSLVPPSLHGTVGGRAIGLQVALEPAKEVGGDLVDYFVFGDDLMAFLVGDVSDKGAGAALMMARTHSLFRGLYGRPDAAELFRAPAKAADIVNAALADGNDGCMFVTLFLGVLSASTGALTYVRAGHVPPFHWQGGARAVARLAEPGGPPLGLSQTVRYREHRAAIGEGDRLLVVTDGFTEASDPSGAFFGEPRLQGLFESLPPGGPLSALFSAVHDFEGHDRQFDDMAAVLLTIGGAS